MNPMIISCSSFREGNFESESLDNGSGTNDCVRKYAHVGEREQSCDAGHILANRLVVMATNLLIFS